MSDIAQLDFKLAKIAQQDLLQLLPPEEATEEVAHVLARGCLPHCIAVISEIQADTKNALPVGLRQHLSFLVANGAHKVKGTSNPELYDTVHGWRITPLADRLRAVHHPVVMQYLLYGPEDTDAELAAARGRVRTSTERKHLERLKQYGGTNRAAWLDAIESTLHEGGNCIVSILIPNLSGDDIESRHSVVVTGIDAETVQYFDPDKYNVSRYAAKASAQKITRLPGDELLYTQPRDLFLTRMVGEVMHVFLPE